MMYVQSTTEETKLMRSSFTREIMKPAPAMWLKYWHVCIVLYELL